MAKHKQASKGILVYLLLEHDGEAPDQAVVVPLTWQVLLEEDPTSS